MKNKSIIFGILFLLFACNKPTGELVGVGGKSSFKEATPYGMVYIKRGAFLMGDNDESVFGNSNEKPMNVSIDAFWMDKTEITNNQYRQFVHWVRDSITRRALLLAGNEEFRLKDRSGLSEELPPEIAPLNWKTKIRWNSKDEDVRSVLSDFFVEDVFGRKTGDLNISALRYEYEWVNYDQATSLRNKYNPNTGAYPEGATVLVDTSYVDDSGVIRSKTIERKLRTNRDLVSKKIVCIYPDTLVWLGDFENAYNDPRMRMYFNHQGYSEYPVVGVSWTQAEAFCRWRTELFNSSHKVKSQDYRLPTEAEWEYAARGGRKFALYPWGGNYVRDKKGCYRANFKPLQGNYTDDEGTVTMKVGSFAPNDYGLYDMAGNVSEWTSSAFSTISSSFVNDMNPTYQYSARNDDPEILKRKVIKGGSWKDISYYLQCGAKTYEYQDEARPYIGFRCVRSYNGD